MTNYAINNADLMAQDAIRRRALLAQQNGYVQQTNSADEESIMTQNQSAKSDNVVGKDDGKIGFWKGLKSFGKGLLNFAGGLIGFDRNGNWSAGRLLKNAVIGAGIAAACVLTAGTALPAIIAGAGVATAGWGLAKSQYQFWTAKTDAQAIAAMEDTGSNVAGLGLSLVGAKATMRQVPGVDAAKYKGFMGTLRAGWDSTTIGYKQGWSAIKTGYNAYRASALRTVAKENWTGFTNTVVKNYKDATKVPTLEKQQTNRVKQYEDRITKLQEKVNTTKDNKVKASLDEQIKKLNEEKASIERAYNNMNSETTFSKAHERLNNLQDAIADLKRKTESCTDAKVKASNENLIARYEQQMEVYKSVLNQKTTQARNIRAEIDKIEKIKVEDRSPKQIEQLVKLQEQQKALNFELPSRKNYETYTKSATESSQKVIKAEESYNKAQKEYETAETAYNKYKKGDTSAEALKAKQAMENSKKVADKAYQEYLEVQKANRTNQAFQSAASGADYAGVFLPKAVQFFKTFNNKYGTEGQKIASTRFSIPSNISAHAIIATNEWVNPSVGGPSLDEMLMQELQNEQVAQYKQATQTQQAPTEADYAQYQQMMNEYQALLQAQQAQQAQAGVQQTAHQAPTAADYQALDYLMKANGIVA